MKEISKEDINEIVKLHKDGLSPKKISNIFENFSESQIRNLLKNVGEHNNHLYTESELKSIISDYNNNMSFVELGIKYKRHPNSILYKLKSIGVHNPRSKKQFDVDDVKNTVFSKGYYFINDVNNDDNFSNCIEIIDREGYKYNPKISYIYDDIVFEKFHPLNKFTIDNINNFFKTNRDDEYECLSDKYCGNNILMQFRHKKCNTVFEATWCQMQGKFSENGKDKYYKTCPNCNSFKTESNHALILKQIFKHEYLDTETEERSCINPLTGCALPTDIVNHRLKIAIEIQSGVHERNNRQEIDKFKKQFWINKGYKFYDPDIRNYSILEMIQIFFPHITEIPQYINYNFSDCVDFNLVQDYLNNGYLLKEISYIMNINYNTIASLVTTKKCFLPKDYKKYSHNIKSIIRLSKDGDFLERYETLLSIEQNGYATGTIRRVLAGKQNFAYDSFWLYECDYISGNYVLPTNKFDKFTLPVDKYDEYNNFICSYESIYEAEKDSASSRSEIFRVANGDRKTSRHEKWKFSNTK